MGNREKPTAIQVLHFLTIGAFPRTIAEDLIARVSRRVSVPCRLGEAALTELLPLLPDREQVDADAILNQLEQIRAEQGTILFGVTLMDISIRIFTFVFGQARHQGNAAVVSLARLRPEFYGLAADPELTLRRAATEIFHELGHVAGLTHCVDFNCLMHFATSAEFIDLRGDSYCNSCRTELPEGLFLPNRARE